MKISRVHERSPGDLVGLCSFSPIRSLIILNNLPGRVSPLFVLASRVRATVGGQSEDQCF